MKDQKNPGNGTQSPIEIFTEGLNKKLLHIYFIHNREKNLVGTANWTYSGFHQDYSNAMDSSMHSKLLWKFSFLLLKTVSYLFSFISYLYTF